MVARILCTQQRNVFNVEKNTNLLVESKNFALNAVSKIIKNIIDNIKNNGKKNLEKRINIKSGKNNDAYLIKNIWQYTQKLIYDSIDHLDGGGLDDSVEATLGAGSDAWKFLDFQPELIPAP